VEGVKRGVAAEGVKWMERAESLHDISGFVPPEASFAS